MRFREAVRGLSCGVEGEAESGDNKRGVDCTAGLAV